MGSAHMDQPARYNAAVDLIERNLVPARASKIAVMEAAGSYTYAELADRVNRCANALLSLGIQPEQRMILGLLDTIDFPTVFLAAIKSGIIPIPLNTFFQPLDYAYVLCDSRAKAVVSSESLLPLVLEAARIADWHGRIIVSGNAPGGDFAHLSSVMERASSSATAAPTQPDDVCFWLYSSGSTGKPKAAVHLQTSLILTADLFARQVLGMRDTDIVYSASKLFFAYGLGNALTFPFTVGATSVLFSGRANAKAVGDVLRKFRPTIFCAVPTLFSALLASQELPNRAELVLRLCTSAGEALPQELGRAWSARTGVEIVDGLGSTEMLHIFISNRPGACRYGTIGAPVPGYKVRLVDDSGKEVPAGSIGDLYVSGPTSAAYYWNNREKTRSTFVGEWVKTGDRLRQTPEGEYVYCGRSDEMLKVAGMWVSPIEVESAFMAHDGVLEAAVIGAQDENGLIKPKAYVVVKPGVARGPELLRELEVFVKSRLVPYQQPRWIEFIEELPKTSTGKIQRYVLRQAAAEMQRESSKP